MTDLSWALKSHPTGSSYTCDPPVTDTDIDTVVLVNPLVDYHDILLKDGWKFNQEYEATGYFTSYRKDNMNLIVTESPAYYLCYVKATMAAKALNLLDKKDRITLFQTILTTGIDGGSALNEVVLQQHDQIFEEWVERAAIIVPPPMPAAPDLEPINRRDPFRALEERIQERGLRFNRLGPLVFNE